MPRSGCGERSPDVGPRRRRHTIGHEPGEAIPTSATRTRTCACGAGCSVALPAAASAPSRLRPIALSPRPGTSSPARGHRADGAELDGPVSTDDVPGAEERHSPQRTARTGWELVPGFAKSLLYGGVAGSVSKTVIAPLDRTKILFQVSHRAFSFAAAARELRRIVVQEGTAALWKGNTATVARVFPYAGVQFMAHEQYKRLLLRLREPTHPPGHGSGDGGGGGGDGLTPVERMFLGASAGATSVAATYPLDLMRARLAVQIHDRRYGTLWHGIRTLHCEEGLRGMFRGATPTFLGILPYAGLSWMTFGTLKNAVAERSGRPVPAHVSLACGAVAGLVAQSATYPLDLVRRRMQTHGFMVGTAEVRPLHASHGIAATLRTIWSEGGRRSLFKGLAMNWIKGPIAVGISFATFDMLKRALGAG